MRKNPLPWLLSGLAVLVVMIASVSASNVLAPFSSQPAALSVAVQAEIQALLGEVFKIEQQIAGLGGAPVPLPPSLTATSTSPISPLPAPCILTSNLAPHSSGPQVTCLQTILIGQGLLDPQYATGYYGAITTAAVQSFQTAHYIISSGTPDSTGYGAAGPRTRAALNALVSTLTVSSILPVTATSTPTATISFFPVGAGGGGGSPAPPPISAPACNLSVDSQSITAGNSATLSWTTGNATTATIDTGIGSVNLNGSMMVSPAASVTYTMTATGLGGSATCTVSVTVTAPTPPVVPLTVSTLYPSVAHAGEDLTIAGTGFNPVQDTIKLTGPTSHQFTAVGIQDGTLLSISLPLSMTPGSYTAIVGNGSSTSNAFPFIVSTPPTPPSPPSLASAQTFLTISPNPCQVSGGICTTVVSWQSPASSTSLWVTEDGIATKLVGCTKGTGTSTIPWITQGHVYEFSLYAVSGCKTPPNSTAGLDWLAAASVTGIPRAALHYPPPNVGAEHIELFTQYEGLAGAGTDGTGSDAVRAVQTAMAEKSLDDDKLMGANYVRVGIIGFRPQDFLLYMTDPSAYWSYMDTMIHDMHARGLAIVPYFNWTESDIPTLTGETIADFYGNEHSKSYQLFATFVTQFIERYKNDPDASIYFYDIGGESNNAADIDYKTYQCKVSAAWPCTVAGNFSTNQLIAFQTRIASLIRTIDPQHPIGPGDSVARPAAFHTELKPAWAGGPDYTLDTQAQLTSYVTHLDQGMDLIELHFYDTPQGATTGNQRFCPGTDCISGTDNADLLDVYSSIATSTGRSLYIGEFGDDQPYIGSFLPGFGPFTKNVLDKVAALNIPYSAVYTTEFYASLADVDRSYGSDLFSIEPGYTDSLYQYMRQINSQLGSVVTPPLDPLPLIDNVLTFPITGTALTGTSTILFDVASAPYVGSGITQVQFLVDGTPLSTITTPPYTITLVNSTLASGTHTIETIARDSSGNTQTSNMATVTCAPTICLGETTEAYQLHNVAAAAASVLPGLINALEQFFGRLL